MTDNAAMSRNPFHQRKTNLKLRDLSKAAQHSLAYSRMVIFLRLVLPLLAICGLLLLVIWPHVSTLGLQAVALSKVPNLMVEDLNLTGIDNKNRPYAVRAKRALQVGNLNNVIELEGPKAEITLEDGTWITGGSQSGRYDQKAENLWLGGNVELFHDKGYRFTTNELFVDMKSYTAWGEKPVLFQGSFGSVEGEALKILQNGGIVIIKGPAKAHLEVRD